MDKLLDPFMLIPTVVIVYIWATMFGAWWYFRRKPKPTYEPPALTDWRTTGVVDFTCQDKIMLSDQDGIPAQFVLRVQEQRQVANIAGTPLTEHRWRLATKAEAKDVVMIVAIYRKDK